MRSFIRRTTAHWLSSARLFRTVESDSSRVSACHRLLPLVTKCGSTVTAALSKVRSPPGCPLPVPECALLPGTPAVFAPVARWQDKRSNGGIRDR